MALKTLEQFKTESQAEVDAIKTANGGDGLFAQVNDERREFTDAEYDNMVDGMAIAKLDKQDNGYKNDRREAYASIQDQLDMQYWDEKNGTTDWVEHIDKVKSDYPKPS